MNGDFTVNEREERKKIAIDLTRYMVHEHYCNNNEEALIALFDDTDHLDRRRRGGIRLRSRRRGEDFPLLQRQGPPLPYFR